ncbi:MAG: 4Fe-4S binding protein [Anaerolineae bacterium]|nr:MAG: 4Fe-4S binding protein [Anaerolineae bacterium]
MTTQTAKINSVLSPAVVHRRRRERTERVLAGLTVLLLLGAWIFGASRQGADRAGYLAQALPEAESFERRGDLWVGTRTAPEGGETLVGYVGLGEAPGYGGPLEMMVAIDPAGNVAGVVVISHRDTPSFFHKLAANDFFDQLLGRPAGDGFALGEDLDGVTGATISAEGVAGAVRLAARDLSLAGLGQPVPEAPARLKVSLPEFVLVALYAVAYYAHRPNARFKNALRWGTMLSGIIFLGFWFNRPLTIAHITSLLSGYWPDWHTNLYWFLLVGGVFLVVTVDGKNPYCSWFCPFGAAQECLSAVGQVRLTPPRRWATALTWVQRGLAFGALFLGLALRQPSATSYEIFGTLFDFTGSRLQWVLLFLILLGSLFIYRPWCNYLCPLRPVVDLITYLRRWGREQWRALWLNLRSKTSSAESRLP